MRQEIEFHGAAVEIAGEADEMGFDLADLLAEGRVRADVAGGRPGPRLRLLSESEDSGGINAVERDQGIVVLTWWLGAYALIFGVSLVVLRLRRGSMNIGAADDAEPRAP